MGAIVDIYSKTNSEIKKFLDEFYNVDAQVSDDCKWEIIYQNPTQAADIISAYVDNYDNFNINMWISLDKDFFINVTNTNADNIIRYLFERFPY